MNPLTRLALKQVRGVAPTKVNPRSVCLQYRNLNDLPQRHDNEKASSDRELQDALQKLKLRRKRASAGSHSAVLQSSEMRNVVLALRRDCKLHSLDNLKAGLIGMAEAVKRDFKSRPATPEMKDAAQDAWKVLEAKSSLMKPEDVITTFSALLRLGVAFTSAMQATIADIALTKADEFDHKNVTQLLMVASKARVDSQVKDHLVKRLSQMAPTMTLRDVGPLLGTLRQTGSRDDKCLEMCQRLIAEEGGSLMTAERDLLNKRLSHFT